MPFMAMNGFSVDESVVGSFVRDTLLVEKWLNVYACINATAFMITNKNNATHAARFKNRFLFILSYYDGACSSLRRIEDKFLFYCFIHGFEKCFPSFARIYES